MSQVLKSSQPAVFGCLLDTVGDPAARDADNAIAAGDNRLLTAIRLIRG